IDEKIKIFQNKYPDGIPAKYKDLWDSYQSQRQEYSNAVETARLKVADMQNKGLDHVKSNLESLLREEAKGRASRSWATTTATVSEQVESRADQVVLTQWRMENQRALADARMRFDYQRHRERLNFDMIKYENELPLKHLDRQLKMKDLEIKEQTLKEKTDKDKPKYDTVGSYLPSESLAGVDVLQNAVSKHREDVFNATFGAESGLIKLVVPGEFGKFNGPLQKLKQMSSGADVNLSDQDRKTLQEYANRVGADYVDPVDLQTSGVLLETLSLGTAAKSKDL